MGRERQLWHCRIKQYLVIQPVTADVHTFISLAIKALRHHFLAIVKYKHNQFFRQAKQNRFNTLCIEAVLSGL